MTCELPDVRAHQLQREDLSKGSLDVPLHRDVLAHIARVIVIVIGMKLLSRFIDATDKAASLKQKIKPQKP